MNPRILAGRVPHARSAVVRLARGEPCSGSDVFPDLTLREKQAWGYKFLNRLEQLGLLRKEGSKGSARRYVAADPAAFNTMTFEELQAIVATATLPQPEVPEPEVPDPEVPEPEVPDPEQDDRDHAVPVEDDAPAAAEAMAGVAALLAERLGHMTDAMVAMHERAEASARKVDALAAGVEALAQKVAFVGGRVQETIEKQRELQESFENQEIDLGEEDRAAIEKLRAEVGQLKDRPVVVRQPVAPPPANLLGPGEVADILRAATREMWDEIAKLNAKADQLATAKEVARAANVLAERNLSLEARVEQLEAKLAGVGDRCDAALLEFAARHKELAKGVEERDAEKWAELEKNVQVVFKQVDQRLEEFGEGAGEAISDGFKKLGGVVTRSFAEMQDHALKEVGDRLTKDLELVARAVRFVKEYAPDVRETPRTLPMSIAAADMGKNR